jgi:hypothetical protein
MRAFRLPGLTQISLTNLYLRWGPPLVLHGSGSASNMPNCGSSKTASAPRGEQRAAVLWGGPLANTGIRQKSQVKSARRADRGKDLSVLQETATSVLV